MNKLELKKKLFLIGQSFLLLLGLFLLSGGKIISVNWSEILFGIGIALIAASLIALFNRIFTDDDNKTDADSSKTDDDNSKKVEIQALLNQSETEKDNLGIVKIYENRSEINDKINNAIKESATQIDVMTQDGLYLIRKKSTIEKTIKNRLMNDLRMRILVPLKIKESYFETNINGLVEWWRSELNETQKANCKIHCYDGTPQDLYFHIDKMIFVGPFFYFLPTDQTTITYEFKEGTTGGVIYTDLFDYIWKESKEINIKNGEENK